MNQGFQQFLRQWFQSLPGRRVFNQEKLLVDEAVDNLFGYFLVQLGCVSKENLAEKSRIACKLLVDETLSKDSMVKPGINWVQAELDFLPIGKDKADVVFLPHTLETVDDPYYLLRQVDTMLLPEGHIVLTGFNKIACMPFRLKHFSKLSAFKQAKYRRAHKIKEWLEVLGYEVKTVKYSSVMCFTANEKYTSWAKFIEKIETALKSIGLDFGNVYCLVAKKRVDSPTLVGLKWHLPKWQGVRNGSAANGTAASKQNIKQLKTEK